VNVLAQLGIHHESGNYSLQDIITDDWRPNDVAGVVWTESFQRSKKIEVSRKIKLLAEVLDPTTSKAGNKGKARRKKHKTFLAFIKKLKHQRCREDKSDDGARKWRVPAFDFLIRLCEAVSVLIPRDP